MIAWGLVLCGLAIGHLMSNAFGPGNVWANLTALGIGIALILAGFVRYERKLERFSSDRYENPRNKWL
jgi:hypothetical protein